MAALSVTRAKLAVLEQIPAGTVQLFHTFNGAVSIPRGWIPLRGNTLTLAEYENTHGAGTYATDGVASSALLNKNLPDLRSRYAVGVETTTQNGSVAITFVGNASNQINLAHTHTSSGHTHTGPSHTHTGPDHSHLWSTTSGSNLRSFNASGTAVNLGGGGTEGLTFAATNSMGDIVGGTGSFTSMAGTGATGASGTGATGSASPTTDSSGSATQSIQPHSCELIYIMKVI